MKQKKRISALLLALTLCVGLLAGCGPKEPEPTDPPASTQTTTPTGTPAPAAENLHQGEWSFTDSLGRTAQFSGPLTRVAPSGKLAQQAIFAVRPEVIVGLSGKLSKSEQAYFPKEFADLPVFGTFYGKKANFNRESVLAAEPQVVIDVGQQKKNMAQDLDALQEQLGIPVIFIEAELTDLESAFDTLGELLEAPEQGKRLADYCSSTISDALTRADSIPEGERKSVYYGLQDAGLTTCAAGDLHGEVIELVGGVNVVPPDLGRSFVEVDLERVLAWNPDVMIFGPNSIYNTVGEDPLWKDLSAVANKTYYEIPEGPYGWIDQPTAANRVLGVKWLGNLLYPEVFDYDMAAETVAFYDLFYHAQLTEDQAKELMANSTYRAD